MKIFICIGEYITLFIAEMLYFYDCLYDFMPEFLIKLVFKSINSIGIRNEIKSNAGVLYD